MMNNIRSLNWTDYLFYVLTGPSKVYYLLRNSDKKFSIFLFIIPLFIVLEKILMASFFSPQNEFFYIIVTFGTVYYFLSFVISSFVYNAVIDVFFQVIGAAGQFKYTFSIYILSLFPRLFLLPILYLIKVCHFNYELLNLFFYGFFWLLFAIWGFVVFVINISSVYGMSIGKSLGVVIAPIIIGLVFEVFSVILFLIMILEFLKFS